MNTSTLLEHLGRTVAFLALCVSASAANPRVKLRGYGVVAETFTVREIGGQSAGALRIACEDPGKAKLVQAKYLSDLQLLPGVERARQIAGPWRGESPRSSGTHLSVCAVKDQGFVVAARSGATVWILASPTVAGLEKLVEQNLAASTGPLVSTPEVSVPMFLDRWDKYGFRFYYGPFVKPQDADHREVATYDPRQDFTFAKRSGDAGLVVWNCALWRAFGGRDHRFQFEGLGLQSGPPTEIAHGREPRSGRQKCQSGQPLSQ